MKIIIEREGGMNKITDKYSSVKELIDSAVNGFVNVGEDEYLNLSHVLAINVVEERPQG